MTAFIVKRLLAGAITVWVVSLVVFAIFVLLPAGDPAQRIAGKNATPEMIEQIREEFRFDESLLSQYAYMMQQLLTGELKSYSMGVKVVPLVLSAMPVTFSLAMFAVFFFLSFGIAFGIKGARNPGSRMDRSLMILALAGVSLPMAWLSLLTLMMFTDKMPIFPAGDYLPIGQGGVLGWMFHLLLPALTLSIVFAGVYTRMSRTTIAQAMREEYVKTAVAKGIPERQVFGRHVLRVGLIPILVMLGLDIAGLMGGAIFTESIFNLPGLGNVLMNGIKTQDYPILMTAVIIGASFVVLANLVVDILTGFLDPRLSVK